MRRVHSETSDPIEDLIRNWACLSQLGYSFRGIKRKRLQPTGNFYRRFVFLTHRASRSIEISNFYANDLGPIFVNNLEASKKLSFPSFCVEDWLDYHATDLPEELSRKEYLKLVFSTKESGVEPVLEFLERLFLGPLKPILTGETWENIPWDDTYK